MEHTKARLEKFSKKKWESKIMHGQYNKSTGKQLVSKKMYSYYYRGET